MNYYSHIDIDTESANEILQRFSSNLEENFKQAIVKNLLAMKLDKQHQQSHGK